MANKQFKNWSEIERYLKKQINDVLINEVSEVVKDEIQSTLSDTVYSYKPKRYKQRKYTDGGLGDKETINTEPASDGVIKITPNAERNKNYKYAGRGYDIDKSLAENIVEGYGDRKQEWNQPRDFIGETKENLKTSKAHIEAMRDGLKNRLGEDAVE